MTKEPVFEVNEYFDGPRVGIASFRGKRCHFKSRYLDAVEYKGDSESVDIFEITPLDAPDDAKPILATAEFNTVVGEAHSTKGVLGALEVTWEEVE